MNQTTARTASMATVWGVTAVVLAYAAAWVGLYFATDHEARDFIKIGTSFQSQSDVSDVIEVDPNYVPPRNRDAPQGTGYDGQFSYYMALDFENARHYMDLPAYRYSRVLYPVLARAAAFGDPDLVPVAMIVLNWLALGLLTLAVAAWLRRRSCSPWFALVVGLYPGFLLGLQRDLTEPLAYALVAAGVYLSDYGGRRRLIWSGAVFGLAGLARQTTVVFPLCLIGSLLLSGDGGRTIMGRIRSNVGRVSVFAALALAPIVAFTAFLYIWLNELGKGAFLEWIPFAGIVRSTEWELLRQPLVLVTVVTPSLVVAGAALFAVRRVGMRVEFAYLLANVLLFVVLVGRDVYSDGYTSGSRVAAGVVLATVYCVPLLQEHGPATSRALIASLVLWMSMLPVIAIYGFGG